MGHHPPALLKRHLPSLGTAHQRTTPPAQAARPPRTAQQPVDPTAILHPARRLATTILPADPEATLTWRVPSARSRLKITAGTTPSSSPVSLLDLTPGTTFNVEKKYEYIKQIGVGAYGVVISAVDRKADRKVAIKKVPKAFDDLIDAKRIVREIKLLAFFNHDNII